MDVGVHDLWMREGLQLLAKNSAQSGMRVNVDAGLGSVEARAEWIRNPRAGFVLKKMGKWSEMHVVFDNMVRASEPINLDSQLLSLVTRNQVRRTRSPRLLEKEVALHRTKWAAIHHTEHGQTEELVTEMHRHGALQIELSSHTIGACFGWFVGWACLPKDHRRLSRCAVA